MLFRDKADLFLTFIVADAESEALLRHSVRG